MAKDTVKKHFVILTKTDDRLKSISDCIAEIMPFHIERGEVEGSRTNACLLEKMEIELRGCLENVEYLREENEIESTEE